MFLADGYEYAIVPDNADTVGEDSVPPGSPGTEHCTFK